MKKISQLLMAALLIMTVSSCEKDDERLDISSAFYDPDDSEVESIHISIPYVDMLSQNEEEIELLCNVSVFDQNNFPIFDLVAANFEFFYRYDDAENGFICIDNFEIDTDEEHPAATVITMDYSGSMSDTDVEHMEEAVTAYVENIRPGDKVQIIKFASYVEVMNEFTNDQETLLDAIQEPFNRGMTAFYDAVYLGLENLDALMQDGQYTPLVIAFTDGHDNFSQHSLNALTDYSATLQIPVYTVGLGHIDQNTLTEIAIQTGGFFQYTADAADIMNLFDLIQDHIDNLYHIKLPIHAVESNSNKVEIKARVFYENALGTHTAETQQGYVIPD